eukprot:TRINITY_DN64342_c0_g1_i1.p1 TRINITY_DN64342_c0_g1~~TRINITY_DN64342_c0_g1_i1.p1  ORF type:complete len:546 (+),score=117.50 TRINITY_DN64342_c0_g1_i1:93-1730(+)
MQPLIYLGVRAWLAWLQLCEKSERAFTNSPIVLVAAGAVHSWAVVYSLFVAVHARAARVAGYHDGYVDHLPASVAWTETFATGCFWIWLVAGFSTAAAQALDDTPDLGGAKLDILTQVARSPVFRSALANAHSISCAGLFLSLISLCGAVAMMSGSITVCEACLLLVSVGIALPHAILAVRRLHETLDELLAALLPPDAVEAAAAEAALFGPQLCVLLALVDSPGHAYLWQNLVYVLASGGYLASLAACALNPPKQSNTALPPEAMDTVTSLTMDGMAAAVIVMSYPDWNNFSLWMFIIILAGMAFATAVRQKDFREFYMEWLEPIFPIKDDSKQKPNAQRQLIQTCARGVAILCATAGLWDMLFHTTVHAGQMYAPPDWSDILLLRWQPSQSGKESAEMLKIATEALGLNENDLQLQGTLEDHRLMLFGYKTSTAGKMASQWKRAKDAPKGELAQLIDTSFAPWALDYTMCSASKGAKGDLKNSEQHLAFEAACDWMVDKVRRTGELIQQILNNASEAKADAAPTGSDSKDSKDSGDEAGSDLG